MSYLLEVFVECLSLFVLIGNVLKMIKNVMVKKIVKMVQMKKFVLNKFFLKILVFYFGIDFGLLVLWEECLLLEYGFGEYGKKLWQFDLKWIDFM